MENSHKSPKLDTKEFELPETHFVRDIENRVFQGIVLKTLSKIEGITLLEGNFINNLLGRDTLEGVRGIYTEQDTKKQCVSIKIEVNVGYGVSIPKKAEEIQNKITNDIVEFTGLHVSNVHVVFKNMAPDHQLKKISEILEHTAPSLTIVGSESNDRHTS